MQILQKRSRVQQPLSPRGWRWIIRTHEVSGHRITCLWQRVSPAGVFLVRVYLQTIQTSPGSFEECIPPFARAHRGSPLLCAQVPVRLYFAGLRHPSGELLGSVDPRRQPFIYVIPCYKATDTRCIPIFHILPH